MFKNYRDIPSIVLIDLYRTMLKIRKVQRAIESEYPLDEMHTPVHLCIGQEAVAAGVCAGLKRKDFVYSNHRGHGHYIAKGGSLKSMIAELYGKEIGCSRGRGGSMHLIDTSVDLMGSSSIVGGGISIATGNALAIKMRKQKEVSVVFFGDGAVDEGVLYESVNFALLKKLPVIYVCENNLFAVCSSCSSRHSSDNIYKRFSGSGLTGHRANGNDVVETYTVAKKVIEKARALSQPAFLELKTYRWCGHSGGGPDTDLGYRTAGELKKQQELCPVKNFEDFLMKKNILKKKNKEAIEKVIDKEIKNAFSFAKKSPFPKKKDLMKYLYKD